MHDIGETVVNAVAALAATSLSHFGVTLKDAPTHAKPETPVVRRVRPVRTRPIASLRTDPAPCPDRDQPL